MTTLTQTVLGLAWICLTSTLFATQSIDLGYLQNGSVSIATESTSDSYIALIDTASNTVTADVNCTYDGWIYSSPDDWYQFYGYSANPGVSFAKSGWQNLEITGLPPGNYRLESTPLWDSNSSSTSYQWNGSHYIIDYAPYDWGFVQVSYFISTY